MPAPKGALILARKGACHGIEKVHRVPSARSDVLLLQLSSRTAVIWEGTLSMGRDSHRSYSV